MQTPTHRPPRNVAHLSWKQQLLVRLDETVGLLDSITQQLDRLLTLADGCCEAEATGSGDDLLSFLLQAAEEEP